MQTIYRNTPCPLQRVRLRAVVLVLLIGSLCLFACGDGKSSGKRADAPLKCDTVTDSIRVEAIRLNDIATGIFIRNSYRGSKDSLQLVIDLMIRACEIDSTNYMMHSVKARYLGYMKRYQEAVQSLVRARKVAPNVCEVATVHGVMV